MKTQKNTFFPISWSSKIPIIIFLKINKNRPIYSPVWLIILSAIPGYICVTVSSLTCVTISCVGISHHLVCHSVTISCITVSPVTSSALEYPFSFSCLGPMSLSLVLKNIYSFLKVLEQAYCKHVTQWDAQSLANACRWATYCEQVGISYRSDGPLIVNK